MDVRWMTDEAPVRGAVLATRETTAAQAYKVLLGYMSSSEGLPSYLDGYWSVGPVSYKRSKAGALVPKQVDNPTSVWYTAGVADVSMDNEDNQYGWS